jgi:hypothetical protein
MNEVILKITGSVLYDCEMMVLRLIGISDVLLRYSVSFVFSSCLGNIYLQDGYLQKLAGSTTSAARPCARFTISHLQFLDVSCAMLSPLLYVFTFPVQPFKDRS